jgi:hypothetical protein
MAGVVATLALLWLVALLWASKCYEVGKVQKAIENLEQVCYNGK